MFIVHRVQSSVVVCALVALLAFASVVFTLEISDADAAIGTSTPPGFCYQSEENAIKFTSDGVAYVCLCVQDPFEAPRVSCTWYEFDNADQDGEVDIYAYGAGSLRIRSHGVTAATNGRYRFKGTVDAVIFGTDSQSLPQQVGAGGFVEAVSSQYLDIFAGTWVYCTHSGIQASTSQTPRWTVSLSYGSQPCGGSLYRTVATGMFFNPFDGQWHGSTVTTGYEDWRGCLFCLGGGAVAPLTAEQWKAIENSPPAEPPEWVKNLPHPSELKSDPLPDGGYAGTGDT